MKNTPYIQFDYGKVVENYQLFKKLMPRVNIAYAVKTNSHPDVIKTLLAQGSGFDVASMAEVEIVRSCGINAPYAPLYYSNPIRSEYDIVKSFLTHKVRHFVVDSLDGIHLLKTLPEDVKKDSIFYVRMYIPNNNSVQPLNAKFGADIEEIEKLLIEAVKIGINIAGVSFHVGSQCLTPGAFIPAIQKADYVLGLIKEHNPIEQRLLLNLGGGFPATNDEKASLERFAEIINKELEGFDDTVDIVAEPGRRMVANAGVLFTKVLLTKSMDRFRNPTAYLDAGVYQGLIEMKQGMKFTFDSMKMGRLITWTVAGPTCDSFDILGEFQLPKDLQVGDILTMQNAGAYVTEAGTRFNGFPSAIIG
jgi:ornithine decarboxylase